MRIILKIRQVYTCGKDVLAVRFIYDSNGSISKSVRVDVGMEYDEDEFAVPDAEVTREYFMNVLTHPLLKFELDEDFDKWAWEQVEKYESYVDELVSGPTIERVPEK